MEPQKDKNISDVLRDAVRGGEKAFASIYEEYYSPIWKYLFFRVKSTGEAEDLAQTVFLKIFEAKNGQTDEITKSYLFTVARNVLIDYYRSESHRSHEGEDALEGAMDTMAISHDAIREKEETDLVRKALASLPDEQRETVTLSYIGGLSNAEIADILGKSEPAVRQIKSRGLKSLKAYITKDI